MVFLVRGSKPPFDLNTPQGRDDFEKVSGFIEKGYSSDCRLAYRPELEQLCGAVPVITDDNLGDEYGISLGTLLGALVGKAQ